MPTDAVGESRYKYLGESEEEEEPYNVIQVWAKQLPPSWVLVEALPMISKSTSLTTIYSQ